MELDWHQVAFIWVAVLCASVLRSFTGFGFALAAVPLFSMILAPTDVVVLSAALALALGLISLPSYRGVLKMREMLPLVSMSLIGTAVGVALLDGLPVSLFRVLVGVSVLCACLGITVSRPAKPLSLPGLDWLTGLVSGLMNGALAIPGPPMIVYAMVTEFQPRRSRALLMSFFLVSSLLALVAYGLAGMINARVFGYFLLALPAIYLGDKLGTRLFLSYGDAFYRRVALLGLAAVGIAIILRSVW